MTEQIIKKDSISVLLFDLDGTLVPTDVLAFESIREGLLHECQHIFTFEDYADCFITRKISFDEYLQIKGIKLKNTNFFDSFLSIYDKKVIDKMSSNSIPNGFVAVQKLKKQGYRVGLVTSNSRKNCDYILLRFGANDLFEQIITREDVKNTKPSSDCYDLAVQKMQVSPESCLVIEDTVIGLESALGVGISCVMVVEYSLTTAEDLKRYSVPVFNKVEDLYNALKIV